MCPSGFLAYGSDILEECFPSQTKTIQIKIFLAKSAHLSLNFFLKNKNLRNYIYFIKNLNGCVHFIIISTTHIHLLCWLRPAIYFKLHIIPDFLQFSFYVLRNLTPGVLKCSWAMIQRSLTSLTTIASVDSNFLHVIKNNFPNRYLGFFFPSNRASDSIVFLPLDYTLQVSLDALVFHKWIDIK